MAVVTGWTGHSPTPGDGPSETFGGVAVTKCKYCTQYVRPVWRHRSLKERPTTQSWVHITTIAPGWDARDEKNLYELLDAVTTALPDEAQEELLLLLAQIASAAHRPEMWNVIKRWASSREDL